MLLVLVIAMAMQVQSVEAGRGKHTQTSFEVVVSKASHNLSHGGHGALQSEQLEQPRLQLAESTHASSSQAMSNCCFNGGHCSCKRDADTIGEGCKMMKKRAIIKGDQLPPACEDLGGYISPQMIACILKSD